MFKGLALVGDRVLAADFHNARIDVFDHAGTLVSCSSFVDPDMKRIDGLWGLVPAGGKTLYFAAGLDDEADGLFGFLAL